MKTFSSVFLCPEKMMQLALMCLKVLLIALMIFPLTGLTDTCTLSGCHEYCDLDGAAAEDAIFLFFPASFDPLSMISSYPPPETILYKRYPVAEIDRPPASMI